MEKGFNEEGDATRINESIKKNAKALYLIQQALDPRILVIISEARTTKEAWDIIKIEFQGDLDNSIIQLHSLQREFDAVKMKQGESVQDFVSMVLDIVYQIRMLKEELPQKSISLTPRFSQVVHSIIKVKNLNTLMVELLSGSLKNHETILNIENNHHEGEKSLACWQRFNTIQ